MSDSSSKRKESRPVQLETATLEDAGPLAVVANLAFYDDRKMMLAEFLGPKLDKEDPVKGPPHTSY